MSAWGDRLKRHRTAAKLTQDAVARRLSLEPGLTTAMTSVSRWETGKATPPFHRRAEIERVLGMNGPAPPVPLAGAPPTRTSLDRLTQYLAITAGTPLGDDTARKLDAFVAGLFQTPPPG